MKRIISIILLALFLFNVVGYYGMYVGLSLQASKEMKQKLDAEAYSEDETLTVKIPISLPYQSSSDAFQRIDGDFEKDGKFYNLVKQKMVNDTLHIVYIHDHKENGLFDLLTDFVQANTDSPISKKASKLMENFAKDYLSTSSEIQTASTGWSLAETFSQPEYLVIISPEQVHSPPPKFII